MSATHGDRDAKGNTLRTHADGPGFATPQMEPVSTAGPNMNIERAQHLNRAERRALAKQRRYKK